MRLVLAILLSLILGAVAAQQIVHEERIDPITDEDTSIVGLKTDGYNSFGDQHAVLVVRCRGNDAYDVYVATNAFLGSMDSVPTIYRFDTEPAVSDSWNDATSGTAAFAPPSTRAQIIEGVRRASQLAFRFTSYSGEQHTVIFRLEGFTEYLDRLACLP